MAIYHLSAKVIGRAAGRSSVAAAAYRSGGRLRDARQGIEHDYSRKGDVVHSEILAPETAPDWMRDRDQLWNAVEAVERRKDAQLAREIEVALPRELGRDARLELVRGFVAREFVGRGMIADLSVHEGRARDGREQPHAHIMLSLRELTGDGFGKKAREWNAPERLTGWREAWAREANGALERAGHAARIDHRTLEAQRDTARGRADRERGAGRAELALVHDHDAVTLDREPAPKIGVSAWALERRGIGTERGDRHRDVAARNEARRERGMRQLELRLELLERGRAFVATARERLDGLWDRAQAAMERIRGRGEIERPGQGLERGVTGEVARDRLDREVPRDGLRARLARVLGRGGREDAEPAHGRAEEPERDRGRATGGSEQDRDRGASGAERAGTGDFDQARRDAILGRGKEPERDRHAEVEKGRKAERDIATERDRILGRGPGADRMESEGPERGRGKSERDGWER